MEQMERRQKRLQQQIKDEEQLLSSIQQELQHQQQAWFLGPARRKLLSVITDTRAAALKGNGKKATEGQSNEDESDGSQGDGIRVGPFGRGFII